MPTVIDKIKNCQWLFLEAIGEPEDNSLRLVLIELGVAQDAGASRFDDEQDPSLKALLLQTMPIAHESGHRRFELVWPSYIGYSVRNESYASAEPDAGLEASGSVLVYTNSIYLDYLSKSTFADTQYPGAFKHWAISCQNHCIDVASVGEPSAKVLHAG